MVEQRVQEYHNQMQLQIEKVQANTDRKNALVREEAAQREQQMREETAKRMQQMEDQMLRLFNEKIGQMKNV